MRRIRIDTDLALGTPRGDDDDGFAVAAAAAAAALCPKEIELLRISVVGGNAPAGAALRHDWPVPGGYLAAGSERWLRQAPLRYQSRTFPLWDLAAALDAVGRLPGAAFSPRRRLREFDPVRAWRCFHGLPRDAGGRAGARFSLAIEGAVGSRRGATP